ncbi:MAG: glycosyltransferase [Acidimicrobiales bacterium]
MTYLLEPFHPIELPFDREHKGRSAMRAVYRAARRRPHLIVMEGTGLAGGAAVLALRLAAGIPYVVSSGDAVAPFLRSVVPWSAPVAEVYERMLCRFSHGFIGWSPYLVGRALTFGARRAMTAANWSPQATASESDRATVRAELGIDPDAIVFGIAGTLKWNPRRGYCYGRELVQAVLRANRPDVAVLVVGDGDGRHVLEEDAGDQIGKSVFLTGQIPQSAVASHLAVMDVASLPQSVDSVGAFRYTMKLSEYLTAGLPVVTGQLPAAYDLDDGWLWRLPGDAPWDPRYIEALGRLMRDVTARDLALRRVAVPRAAPVFDAARQRRAVCAFIQDLLDA